MKRKISAMAVALIVWATLPFRVLAAEALIPGGQIVALELRNDRVTVAAFDESLGQSARNAGLRVGDEILAIDGIPVHSPAEIRQALERSGNAVVLTVLRGSKRQTIRMTPCQTESGPKLGIYLRQGIAGIGTVTFYDPETNLFGTLGHGVNEPGGTLLPMTGGQVGAAEILTVKKGRAGDPGQLRGSADGTAIGILSKNTPQGVFGRLHQPLPGQAIPTAAFEEITTGPATIQATVDSNGVREYSVEILKIYPEDRSDCRNFLLQITDPDLLAATGGIVQGMGVIDNRDNTKSPKTKDFQQLP